MAGELRHAALAQERRRLRSIPEVLAGMGWGCWYVFGYMVLERIMSPAINFVDWEPVRLLLASAPPWGERAESRDIMEM